MVSCYPDLENFLNFLREIFPGGGYSESQVTRVIEVFFWVWNFFDSEIFGRKIWREFFWWID